MGLSRSQEAVYHHLKRKADAAGYAEFSEDDIRKLIQVRWAYNIFRQLAAKGYIASLPKRIGRGRYRVKLVQEVGVVVSRECLQRALEQEIMKTLRMPLEELEVKKRFTELLKVYYSLPKIDEITFRTERTQEMQAAASG